MVAEFFLAFILHFLCQQLLLDVLKLFFCHYKHEIMFQRLNLALDNRFLPQKYKQAISMTHARERSIESLLCMDFSMYEKCALVCCLNKRSGKLRETLLALKFCYFFWRFSLTLKLSIEAMA